MFATNADSLPDWLPDSVRFYVQHTEDGQSLRSLAREAGVNASTVLRQVRRYENRRDDPLMDEALSALGQAAIPAELSDEAGPSCGNDSHLPSNTQLQHDGMRLLRRLNAPGAFLACAANMDKAVILRESADGNSTRTAILDRAMARAFILKDWIERRKSGRVSTYTLTTSGREALKRMASASRSAPAQGFAEAPTPFCDRQRVWGERQISENGEAKRIKVNLAESPVAILGRRRDKSGEPFLAPELVEAAERLREDFELAQMGPRIAQNWEKFLTGRDRGSFTDTGGSGSSDRARERVAAALHDLGPGLGDVALRVCCFLEGLETAERRMGWAARSGKIVLRIALMRLRRHYDTEYGRSGPLIG